jgi:hypothetical protein
MREKNTYKTFGIEFLSSVFRRTNFVSGQVSQQSLICCRVWMA